MLREGLRSWQLAHLEDTVPAMVRFAELVERTNRELNLTRIVEPQEMAVKNFLDSLSLLLVDWPEELRCLDLGTGAGFPGVPLALAREGWEITLLDSCAKARFPGWGRWGAWAGQCLHPACPGGRCGQAGTASGKL